MEVKAGTRINLLRLQYIHHITKTLIHFSTLEWFTNSLSMGLSQPSKLFSGRRVVKKKISGNSAYRSCLTEINKIKLCWEERGHIHFPEEVMLTHKKKKMLLSTSCPMEVMNSVQLLFSKRKRASREFRNPPLRVTALSTKESGWIALNSFFLSQQLSEGKLRYPPTSEVELSTF